jgi:spore coat polysaccharide biosynthesis predicted glycosyltransferase SpsG
LNSTRSTGVGLGHVVRAVSLATGMRALASGVRLLVLTNAADTSLRAR